LLLVQFLFPLVTDAETDKSAGRAQRDRETRDLTDSPAERGEETHRLPDLRQPATARSRSTVSPRRRRKVYADFSIVRATSSAGAVAVVRAYPKRCPGAVMALLSPSIRASSDLTETGASSSSSIVRAAQASRSGTWQRGEQTLLPFPSTSISPRSTGRPKDSRFADDAFGWQHPHVELHLICLPAGWPR